MNEERRVTGLSHFSSDSTAAQGPARDACAQKPAFGIPPGTGICKEELTNYYPGQSAKTPPDRIWGKVRGTGIFD